MNRAVVPPIPWQATFLIPPRRVPGGGSPSTGSGVPILAGTYTAGAIAREVALLAEHGLEPAAALRAATTTGYRFLGEPFDQAGQPATLVTYPNDPREDLATLSSPSAIIIDGVRVR